ncbi:hypothetical protein ACIBQX_49565 [Nonomuraea sp. NPDC049714]|uniref:hypothetical protein n=1 Tax=Nonomuraea sp. NPDC049714 TaxID=3364357 RepID=UPI0037B30C27
MAADSTSGPAAWVAVPVEFLLQWDDELVPRDAGLASFGAFSSREKTLLRSLPGRAPASKGAEAAGW